MCNAQLKNLDAIAGKLFEKAPAAEAPAADEDEDIKVAQEIIPEVKREIPDRLKYREIIDLTGGENNGNA